MGNRNQGLVKIHKVAAFCFGALWKEVLYDCLDTLSLMVGIELSGRIMYSLD